MNSSALTEYNKQLNIYAGVRDFLITYTTNLIVSTANSITLQASSLTQLTQATNQLTRTTSVRMSTTEIFILIFVNRCWHRQNVIN
jgi:hypothetical protein